MVGQFPAMSPQLVDKTQRGCGLAVANIGRNFRQVSLG
jgi:hypothetical protein